MTYYFAYGSNMDQSQMAERCPESKLIGKAVLKDFKIGFTIFSPKRKCGCADILECKNSEVWGLVYVVSDLDLNNLDIAESHPHKYVRFKVKVEDEQHNSFIAETYKVATKEGDFIKPSKHYLGIMQHATDVFNFPVDYKSHLNNIPTLED